METCTIYLGIDPSLRHTGLCLLQDGQSPYFFEVDTGTKTIWEAERYLIGHLRSFLMGKLGPCQPPVVVGLERQVPNSGILFHTQMVVLDVLMTRMFQPEKWLAMPLPCQVRAYMRDRLMLDTSTKKSVVEGVKKILGMNKERLSQHKADSYCMARLVEDVFKGRWTFKLPSKETHIVPQCIILGG